MAAPAVTGPDRLRLRSGRWIDNWDPEDRGFWEGTGRRIARVNLRWSIFCEFLGFVVWQLWSIVAVQLPAAGFDLSSPQIFWLISMPSLVGATLRIPYTFMVPKFGGRNWTIISALLLLIPAIGLAVCTSNPETPFGVLLLMAGLAGFGGGNFASSMANITYFYPASEKGYALGLNAAGGNLGAAVAQLVVPVAITVGAFGATGGLQLPLAGLVWVPLILLAVWGARRYMHNLSHAKGDVAGSIAALREPHLWIMALLYIGTFGSFIGFSGVFPKLIKDVFPDFSAFAVGSAALSLAFLGPLVGSLARPFGGKLADRFGGARMTVASFAAMAAIALTVVWTLPLANFWLFLLLFLALFTASGFGNGATYRMIPRIFAIRGEDTGPVSGGVDSQRKSSAALGLISAIGAYGGFLIPQVLNASSTSTGSYDGAFYGFVATYALMLALAWFCYLRPGSKMAQGGV
ncbi:MFS transporter [Arthrobacter sp. E918]|uniref:MFS transporter n=1 Tax=Arthrobacter mobilis TaxID=2724944 RepID=A0A7X6HEN5_9MICC|nr:MFS transporter [Arthrobacter mobilis]NKX55676.1 MFS transporter [Arthrobacter mobilis]